MIKQEEIKILVEENISTVKENIEKALSRSGRTGDHVELVAVTKTVDVEKINRAIDAGIESIGENRVQELERKFDQIKKTVDFHMIGHLQSNKAKDLIGKVKLIHSLDRMSLAKELNKRSKAEGLVTDVLLQVNISEEKTKFGLKKDGVFAFIESILSMENIRVKGLMTIAPHIEDEKKLRSIFRELYDLKESIKDKNYDGLSMEYLSMGMTNDYTIAVEEGANIVRVGRGIFGDRKY